MLIQHGKHASFDIFPHKSVKEFMRRKIWLQLGHNLQSCKQVLCGVNLDVCQWLRGMDGKASVWIQGRSTISMIWWSYSLILGPKHLTFFCALINTIKLWIPSLDGHDHQIVPVLYEPLIHVSTIIKNCGVWCCYLDSIFILICVVYVWS